MSASMALSAKAAMALEAVKRDLQFLRNSEYFTKEEFIKLDGLVHKGKYVFTEGPSPQQDIYEEELLSFDDSSDNTKVSNILQFPTDQPFEPTKANSTIISEEHAPSPTSSISLVEATSAEASDEEVAPPPTLRPDASEFTPAITPETTRQTVETGNGLPPGITQAQLDAARSMQAAMTKAGKKIRPKYEPSEASFAEPAIAETLVSGPWRSSPAPTERHSQISSWASEVNAQQPLVQTQILSPKPSQPAVDLDFLTDEYRKIHGRSPKNVNDIYQPNNPAHFSKRASSVTSNTTTKTAKAALRNAATAAKPPTPKAGSTYIAQREQIKTHPMAIQVSRGDEIKVMKFVSGVIWVAHNQRTKLFGQITEDVFRPTTKISQKRSIFTTSPGRKNVELVEDRNADAWKEDSVSAASTPGRRVLETVEDQNADVWQEVSTSSRREAGTPAISSAPVRPPPRSGLASSRFSVLAEKDDLKPQLVQPSQLASASAQPNFTPDQVTAFGQIIDEKVDEILKARGMAPTPAPGATPSYTSKGPSLVRRMKEPLKPIIPKTNTCWFWASGKGCRFLETECRDVHAHIPGAGPPTNLHNGKPTWGALADYISPNAGHADPDLIGLPLVPGAVDATSPVLETELPMSKTMSCWYWSREGKCNYSAEDCKYLHAESTKGVAPRPWAKAVWGNDWNRKDNATGWETKTNAGDVIESGGLVLQEVADDTTTNGWGAVGDGDNGVWGHDTSAQNNDEWGGSGNKYKPPHVKAMEEQSRQEASGW